MGSVAQANLGHANGSSARAARAAGVPIRITPTVLASDAYDSGDVLFDMTEVANAVDVASGYGVIDKIVIYDKGDQTAAVWNLAIASVVTALGTLDSAPNISDANAAGASAGAGLQGLAIATTDWLDFGGVKVATLRDLKLSVKGDANKSIFIGATVTGTPTQGAVSDIVIDVWMA